MLCKPEVKVLKDDKMYHKKNWKISTSPVSIYLKEHGVCLGSNYVLDGRETVTGKPVRMTISQSSCEHSGKRDIAR